MGRRRKKYKRRRKPKFTKFYKISQQDELAVYRIELLQKVYTDIAKEVFNNFPKDNIGDWTIKTQGLTLFIDPEFGLQAEITGTSKLPLLKRLKIHIRLLKLIKKGNGLLWAIKMCLSMLEKQLTN